MSATTSEGSRRLAGLACLLGAAVLLVLGKAATAPPATKIALGRPQPSPTPAPSSGAAAAGRTGSAPVPPSGGRAASGGTGTFLGRPEDVGYGTVQVRVTLTTGRITDVQAVRLPSGGRSSEIAAYAAPRLRSEVLAAQSANIDTVSGASFTSEGYARSVQSALDAAPK
ncbi:MAG: hypothetical protein JWP40_4148 [Blastococcus sp.]|jgi:uncharacterized protein with FMN-binding domain|nr:hypothetical protein [Blastococcus sp.]